MADKPIRPESFGRRPDLAMYLADVADKQGFPKEIRRYLTNYAFGNLSHQELLQLARSRPNAKLALQVLEQAAGSDPGVREAVFEIEMRQQAGDDPVRAKAIHDQWKRRNVRTDAPAQPPAPAGPGAAAPQMPARRDMELAPGRAAEISGGSVARPQGPQMPTMDDIYSRIDSVVDEVLGFLPQASRADKQGFEGDYGQPQIAEPTRTAPPGVIPSNEVADPGMAIVPSNEVADDRAAPRPNYSTPQIIPSTEVADDLAPPRPDYGSPQIIPSTEVADDGNPELIAAQRQRMEAEAAAAAETPAEAPSERPAAAPARRGVMAPEDAPVAPEKAQAASKGLGAKDEWEPDPNRYYDEDGRYVEVVDGEKRVYGFGSKEFFNSLPKKEQERIKTARDSGGGLMGLL